MKTVQEIFDNAIFRIPDYQRGYSWEERHLDDFWQDLRNLQPEKYHYIGTLTLEISDNEQHKKWIGDEWIIEGMNFKPYYVVDGQQRLTTVIILLNSIIDTLKEEEQLLFQDKAQLIEKYIYRQNEKRRLKSFIFGYEIDDPSYEYLKTKIFKQQSSTSFGKPETTYTSNLQFADKYFRDQLKGYNSEAIEKLFKKVTQQLKFDIKTIEDDLDIFVVFETMNNRGKPLSNLEKLKNRLIYLSTLLHDCSNAEKKHLRNEINEAWKTCYEYLGKNKFNRLPDDIFLRNHFIIYHSFSKEKEFPYRDIFKEKYTVNKVTSNPALLDHKQIKSYIHSIQESVVKWYIINNPKQAQVLGLLESEEANWLIKINRLQFRVFAPLVLAAYVNPITTVEQRIAFLKAIESFIFLNYVASSRKRNLGNPFFINLATRLYKNTTTITSVTKDITTWTYGNDSTVGYFNANAFIATIKEYFVRDQFSGYYDWKGLKYFLYEYELFLQGNNPMKVDWDKGVSVEHIYPQSLIKNSWKESFNEFNTQQKKYLCNSLGNMLLLKMPKNIDLSDNDFTFKKKHEMDDGSYDGYFIGSHSEIKVSQYENWDGDTIFTRGYEMLDFFEKRWNVKFTNDDRLNLLLVDPKLIVKFPMEE
jgi:uncharacterized protein with ParB-like and HNH nuclease domain